MYIYCDLFYCCVLKIFWCHLPANGNITTPKHLAAVSKIVRIIYRIMHFFGVMCVIEFIATHRINNVKAT